MFVSGFLHPKTAARKIPAQLAMNIFQIQSSFSLRKPAAVYYVPRRFRSCVWWKSRYCLCVSSSRPKPFSCDNIDRVNDVHRRVQKWIKDREIQDPYYRINPIALEFSKDNIAFLMQDLKIPYCVLLKVTSTSKGGPLGGTGGCLKVEKTKSFLNSATGLESSGENATLRSVVQFLVNDVRLTQLELARILYIHPIVLLYRSEQRIHFRLNLPHLLGGWEVVVMGGQRARPPAAAPALLHRGGA